MQAPERVEADLRAAWRAANVSPLWESMVAHGGKPAKDRPHHWPWRTMAGLIRSALELRGMDVTERRVLSLVDPEPRQPGTPATVVNLNAGLQILAPGETARPHRHSMNAIRFILDGEGATTIVDGKACPMAVGDLVLTPGWTWHEHVHEGAQPIVWLDVLDAQLHRNLGTDRFEPGPKHDVPVLPPDAAFANANVVPEIVSVGGYSPVFRYPWAEAAAAVAAAPPARDGVRRVRYVNPANGGAATNLLDSSLIQIDAGATSLPFRTTAHAVVAVVEGTGTTTIGDTTFAWEPKDVFSLTADDWIVHHAVDGPARLFVTSDREVLRRLDLLVEEFGSA
jgi:gentisate 1,2-dioxygenase